MKPVFTKDDVGCWIDGAFGMQRSRQVLADLVAPHKLRLSHCVACETGQGECQRDHFAPEDVLDCIAALFGDMSHDDWETVFATESLLPALTAPGLVWMWDGGDLILTTEEEVWEEV